MASARAIAASLKMLSRAFAGSVEDKIDVYHAALEDLTDAHLAAATTIVIKTHTGEFIPPPAVLRKAVAPAPVVVDAPAVLRQIEKLASYNPNIGMMYPRAEAVRAILGDAVAYAYSAAGGERIFSENETSRDIATREFQKALTDAANRPDVERQVIGSKRPRLTLTSGDEP